MQQRLSADRKLRNPEKTKLGYNLPRGWNLRKVQMFHHEAREVFGRFLRSKWEVNGRFLGSKWEVLYRPMHVTH